jgi:uncharacterized iron-regulated protein
VRSRLGALCCVVLCALAPAAAHATLIFRLRDARTVGTAEMVRSLGGARVVFFGERHNSPEDHVAQRTVIQALHDGGARLAIGMEMFRRDAQPLLDRWVAGTLDAQGLREVFDANWDGRIYDQYREILLYARAERIPLVALNIDRALVSQVSRLGFASLTAEQRRSLGVESCDVSERYADIMRRFTGGQIFGAASFATFCEAQIVWDAAMARSIADYLRDHPDRSMVVMCGTLHAWRHGIPGRLAAITDAPVRVILPSGDDSMLKYDILLEDADFVWWHQ